MVISLTRFDLSDCRGLLADRKCTNFIQKGLVDFKQMELFLLEVGAKMQFDLFFGGISRNHF